MEWYKSIGLFKKMIFSAFCGSLMVIFFTCMFFAFSGCRVDTDLQQFVVDTGVELAGYEIGQDHPDIIDKALDYCQMLENGTLEQSSLELGIRYLIDNYGDHPVIGARMSKISAYITIDSEIDTDRAKELMPAFRSGLELAKEGL